MLVPVGQALAFDADQGTEFQYVCTVTGIKQISINQASDPVNPDKTVSCPFCLMHYEPTLFVPQQNDIFILDMPVEHAAFGLPLQQFQVSIWRGSLRPSRAPPSIV
ncbi:hypothetical protein BEN30_13870 [Magnetovibrio blakemorei]|uniref:DUF2946 domain-containing protein n=2 Tax=Magnetovibrio blakemorei TaxID=28181 RepID=A0A1E5Q5G6_9PROT|nr:hypothetical protein BEN30_13870 [Magnetovibrio blakemorei]